MGVPPPLPPSIEASRLENLQALWSGAGLEGVETRSITVERTFASFDEVWETSLFSASIGAKIRAMAPADAQALKERLRARLPADASGRITYSARANAVKGRVPK